MEEYLKAPYSARDTEVGPLYFLWLIELGAACFQTCVSSQLRLLTGLNPEDDA